LPVPSARSSPAWRAPLDVHPFGTLTAAGAVVLGFLGVIFGDGVSEGMTISLAGYANIVAHLWGVGFAAGGAAKLIGLYARRTTIEVPGLWLMAGGYAFYSITVVVGLGGHGTAAGVISAAAAIGSVLKARTIMRLALALKSSDDDPPEPP
jgi:hypothetical protein